MQKVRKSAPQGLVIAGLLIILLWGISAAKSFFIPISMSALLAFMMAPLVRIMRRYHFPEWSAIGVSALLLILPFLSLAYILVWQGEALVKDFPNLARALNQGIIHFVKSEVGQRLHLAQDIDINTVITQFEVSAGQGIQWLIGGLGAILGAGSELALILLFAVLMLASRKHLRKTGERILKESMGVENPQILEDVVALFEKFLIARFLIVLIVGGVDTAILTFFKVGYPFLLGCFLGVVTLIPAVGFLMGIIPPLIVSFAGGLSWISTLGWLGSLFLVSLIEGNVLTSKMVGKRLNINALSTFVGLFGGGLLWGVWGMFLSIPVLGVLRITFNAAPSLRPWGDLLAEKNEKPEKLKVAPNDRSRVA